MADYTLHPETDLHVSKKQLVQQFLFFLKQVKRTDVFELGGIRGIRENAKFLKRWGALEAGNLAISARKDPDRTALIDDKGQFTYKELYDETLRLAHGFQDNGVVAGQNVAVLALNGRDVLLPLFARQMVGYHIFMINANSSGQQIEKVLEFHEITTIIVDSNFYGRLTEKTKATVQVIIGYEEDGFSAADEGLKTLQDIIDGASVPETAYRFGEDNLPKNPPRSVHVVMTSGTTGMPKGVVRRMLRSPQGVAPALAAYPLHRNMRLLLTSVLFHFYGWGMLVLCLLTTSTIITQRKFDPERVIKEIDKYDIDSWASAASRLRETCAYLDNAGIERVNGLDFIISSGSPLMPYEVEEVNSKFGRILVNGYGSTETSILAGSSAEELGNDPTLTGTVYPGVRVEIRDEDGNPVPEGETGEVCASTYDMFAGYTDPKIKMRTVDGMLRMGDKGYFKDGKLYVLGRADDLVITQYGEKIFPSEIEDLLVRDDRIGDVHVHGVKDPKYGQALVAYVIRSEGVAPSDLTADDIRATTKAHLSEAHVPRDVFFVDSFPRNPMGKVIRHELPDHSTAPES